MAPARPLRICRIATVPFFLLHHLGSQVRATAQAGHAVLLVASPGPEWPSLRAIPGTQAIELPIARPMAPLTDLRALVGLWRVLRRHPVDILHSTTPKAGLLAALAGLAAGVPVRLHTFTGQAWAELGGPARWIAKAADRLIIALNTRCYADSASQRAFLEAQGVAPRGKVVVLGSGSLAGVDARAFDPARHAAAAPGVRSALGIGPADKVIGFVGRLTRDKGVAELVSAFLTLARKRDDVHLVLVGPQEPERDPLPEEARAAIGGHARIHAIGYSPAPAQYLAASDLMCLPSYREGFGNVVIEAAAMGLPAVGTAIVGLRDAIEDGVTGVLVAPKDATALAVALEAMLADDVRRRRMGESARERALRLFDAETVNARVLSEYAALVQEAGR